MYQQCEQKMKLRSRLKNSTNGSTIQYCIAPQSSVKVEIWPKSPALTVPKKIIDKEFEGFPKWHIRKFSVEQFLRKWPVV
jgi:hypothetical protein